MKLIGDDDLSLDNMIPVTFGNPSVVTVLKRDHTPHLIDISGCSVHMVYNAVKGALNKLDLSNELEEFVQDVSSFMKSHVSLIDEFSELQEELELTQHRIF